jgi:hypothetical protein
MSDFTLTNEQADKIVDAVQDKLIDEVAEGSSSTWQ